MSFAVADRDHAQPRRVGLQVRAAVPGRRHRTERVQLDDHQRELASRFLPLARNLSRPLKILFPFWRDEFESAACYALVEAARTYDPGRSIKFATFARIRIRGALMDVGRSMVLPGFGKHQQVPEVVALTPYSEEHGAVLVASEPPPVGADVDDADAVEAWLRKLPERHATICRLYYLYGKTQAEIAEVVGCSQSEVTRLHQRSIDLLSDPYAPKPARNRAQWSRRKRRVDLTQPRRKPSNRPDDIHPAG